jgi:hypothetical protein
MGVYSKSMGCFLQGVLHTASGPFSATRFFFTLSIASSGITVRPSFSCGVTSTGSHSMGAFAALKMSFTD